MRLIPVLQSRLCLCHSWSNLLCCDLPSVAICHPTYSDMADEGSVKCRSGDSLELYGDKTLYVRRSDISFEAELSPFSNTKMASLFDLAFVFVRFAIPTHVITLYQPALFKAVEDIFSNALICVKQGF